MTEPATTMPRMSPHCIFDGVPPSRWPTLRSWSISPATALEMQTIDGDAQDGSHARLAFHADGDHATARR